MISTMALVNDSELTSDWQHLPLTFSGGSQVCLSITAGAALLPLIPRHFARIRLHATAAKNSSPAYGPEDFLSFPVALRLSLRAATPASARRHHRLREQTGRFE